MLTRSLVKLLRVSVQFVHQQISHACIFSFLHRADQDIGMTDDIEGSMK